MGFECLLDRRVEIRIELSDHLRPLHLALCNLIELLLDARREVVVHNRRERTLQVVIHDHTDIGGCQAALLLTDILREHLALDALAVEGQLLVCALYALLVLLDYITTIDDGGDGRCVGRRTANAQLLQTLHEQRLVVARRCLSESLRSHDRLRRQLLTDRQCGQHTLRCIGSLIVIGRFRIELQETVETNNLARCNELSLTIVHINRNHRAVDLGSHHLRGYGTLPDQLIEALLGCITLDRGAIQVRRTDSLVCLLRALGLGLIVTNLMILLAKELDDLLLGLSQRLTRQIDRVGTHIGDQTLLVQTLSQRHRLRNRHTQLTTCLLLQGRGGERRRGNTLRRLLLALHDRETCALATFEECYRLLALLETAAQLGTERGLVVGRELRHHAIVLRRLEIDDLSLALNQQTHCNALHATRRQTRLDLLPQHGRKLETYQTVQHAACLLRIDQIHIDRTRLLDCTEDSLLCNLVEHNSFGRRYGQTQHLGQVPSDSLSLAVLIGSQPDGFDAMCQLTQFGHHLFLIIGDFVDRAETTIEIDTQILLRQVANMAEARLYNVVLTQKFLDRLGLGRRLDDYQIFLHCS